MSIESLNEDLKAITQSVRELGPLSNASEIAAFLKNNLVPFLENVTGEVSEMDAAIEDVVHSQADILHEATAEVFAGIITAGRVMGAELLARAAGDPKIVAMVKEWMGLAVQGEEILSEITIPDEDDGDEDPDLAPEPPAGEPS